MASTGQPLHPVAHVPLVRGVLRRLAVATVVDRLIPPHPAHGLSWGRGVEALVLALLDGHQALYQVGKRLEERGLRALRPPGLTRAARNDSRLGHRRAALCAATLNRGLSVVALNALAVDALPPPWLPQETTTMALDGASEDDPPPPGAPRPADGPRQDGRDERTQVLLSLGVSGDGGIPSRVGLRDGHRRDRLAPPGAIAAGLA